MKHIAPTIKQILLSDRSADFEQLAAVTSEAQGNLEHIYKAIEDLKCMCTSTSFSSEVDDTFTPEFIKEVAELLKDK